MRYLRSRRKDGKTALQTPVVELEGPAGQRGRLVLTAHLGEREYFERLRKHIDASGAQVFFESVRANSDDPEHWRERYHAFLKAIRVDLYEGLSSLGLLEFQRDYLAPAPDWVNADVDCCALADRLREREVSVWRYEVSLGVFRRLIAQAQAGDASARATLDRTIRWGLVFVSFGAVFQALRFLPSTRRLYEVINDWRSATAVETVLREATGDWLLIYGAAHGETLLDGFQRAGYREVARRWATVFTT